MHAVAFNPKLGPLRHVATVAAVYVIFAIALVYIVAPIRGLTGQLTMRDKLGYDAERWLATAIYDPKGNFVGTFDPRLDSLRDVNYTDAAIDLGDYVANPDHKSIPVRDVPERYWQCLSYHEDRYLGGWLNPFGIDLTGVLKIPISTISQSIARGRPTLGVGGSTLPMQFARVIYKTPPSADEGPIRKLGRKLREWWLAPVIYRELTRGGDNKLKQWAANHIWLAQRTGGQPLHGVEVTSQVVFGKEAKDLSTAEQFVLASAVNKPIILLEGNDKLNEVRLDRWRYITEVRAKICAEKLIDDEAERKATIFELVELAGGPPDPKVRPKLLAALEKFAPDQAKRAEANPMIRANVLLPSARFGLREEMKQRYGFAWRDYVRGLTTTFDVGDNLAFGQKIDATLAALDAKWRDKIDPAYALDPAKATADLTMPDVVVVAANASRRHRPLLRGWRNRALLRIMERARQLNRPLRSPSRGPHDRLDRQDVGRRRHRAGRQGRTRQPLRRYRCAGAGPRDLRQGRRRKARAARHRRLRLLAECAAGQPRRADRPAAHEKADRRLRFCDAAGRGVRRHAAVDRCGARPDRRRAATRAPHVSGDPGGADRQGPNAGQGADADPRL